MNQELELGKKIGEGSFGIVYKANLNEQICAVKRFKLDNFADSQELITKEIEALKSLKHDCIVRLIGVTTDAATEETLLVMEYMEDGSLGDLLARKDVQLSKEDVIQIALDVACGLQYLHSQKVIHRDLKSANVLLYNNGKNAKLSDFGTVRVFVNSTKASTAGIGTIGFMAPEVLHGEPYNDKADVYSFSALLFHILTREYFPPVFRSDSAATSRITADIDDTAFQELILRCCKADPKQRPKIEECIRALLDMMESRHKQFEDTTNTEAHKLSNDLCASKDSTILAEKKSESQEAKSELYAKFDALAEASKQVSNGVEKNKSFKVESTKEVLEKMKQQAFDIEELFRNNEDELQDKEVKKRHKQLNLTVQQMIGDLCYCKKLGKKYQGSKKIKELCREIHRAIHFDFVLNRNTDLPRQQSSPIPSGPNSFVAQPNQKYEISFDSLIVGKEIGSGANGKVYEGKYNKFTKVALKYSSGVMANDFFERKKQFLEAIFILMTLLEVDLLVNLEPHLNIVQLLGYSRAPSTGEMILVLELCTGGSLEHYRRKNNPSEQQILSMLSSIAQGLHHLHVNKVVHRDLTARNVLLHNKMCKISDFGMSKKMLKDQSQTVMKDVAIRWMPPEALQTKFDKGSFVVTFSSKVDVWGFGIVIYELVTGLEPHQHEDQLTIGGRIRDEGYHPRIPTDCPVVLQDLMRDCWQMDPAKRPDMSEISERLEEAMKSV